jgi:Bacterial SH3 domain
MALIKCPDCGGNVSTEAGACPHCGRPIGKSGSAPAAGATVSAKPKSTARLGCALLIMISGLMVCVAILNQNTEKTGTGRSSVPTRQGGDPGATTGAADHFVYAKKEANIRSGPAIDRTIVRKVSEGDQLAYLDKTGEWYKLTSSTEDEEHWVHESVVLTEEERLYRATAQLKVGDWSWHVDYDYAIAEGQVTNVSGSSLENVEAVVTYMTDSGAFITSDNALIEYNPLLSGQTSPWKVMTQHNPAMKSAGVQFKTLFGGSLRAYKD